MNGGTREDDLMGDTTGALTRANLPLVDQKVQTIFSGEFHGELLDHHLERETPRTFSLPSQV